MLRCTYLTASLWLLATVSYAQEPVLVDSTLLQRQPISFSNDLQGDVYLGFENGEVIKYSISGQQLETFSLPSQSAISLLEGKNSLKVFLFQKDNQSIAYLDRFNAVPRTYFLFDFGIEYALSACPSADQNIWVLENNPQRISKIDLLRNSRVVENQLFLGDSISLMRAFQNMIVVSSEQGVHILDQYGRIHSKVPIASVSFFQLIDDHLYLITPDSVFVYDPYKGVSVDTLALPQKADFARYDVHKNLILTKEKRLFVYENKH